LTLPAPLGSPTTVSLATVASVALRRAAGDAFCIAISPAPPVVADGASRVRTVIQLIPTSTGITASAIESFALFFPVPSFTIIVAQRPRAALSIPITIAVTVSVLLSLAIPVTVPIVALLADRRQAADFPVRPLAVGLSFTTVCFIGVGLRCATETTRRPSSLASTVIAIVMFSPASAISVPIALPLPVHVLLFLLQPADELVKSHLAKLI
jgi:hypothetical protein